MKEKAPLVFRIEEALNARLEKSADKLKLKKYKLALMAIEAAVVAIESNNDRLVIPVEFELRVTHVPARDADQLAREIQDKEIEKIKSGDLAGASHTLGKPEAAPSETAAAPTDSPPPPPSGQTDAAGHTPARKRSRRNRKP